ncbi:hypothetical protein niasHS_001185 [Heterodera schachtii]|uniref:Uncharacterized protein n=1 Tax=Heterodera schachtii TaxID=97005 RepID=A0ABD2KCH6_HETSC
MAILLKCVLLLSIMAIFCDCMNTPGKKGNKGSDPIPIPKKEGKSSSSAANSPTVTKGTPKRGGKPRNAEKSPAVAEGTPKRSDALETPKFYASPTRTNKSTPNKDNKKTQQKERQKQRAQKYQVLERMESTISAAGMTTDAETDKEPMDSSIANQLAADSTVEYETETDRELGK